MSKRETDRQTDRQTKPLQVVENEVYSQTLKMTYTLVMMASFRLKYQSDLKLLRMQKKLKTLNHIKIKSCKH